MAKDRVRFACVIGRINRGGEKVNSTHRGNLSPVPLGCHVSCQLSCDGLYAAAATATGRARITYTAAVVFLRTFSTFFSFRFFFVLLPLNPSPSCPIHPLSLTHRREPPPLSRCGRFIRPVRARVSKLYVCHLPTHPPTTIAT